MNGSNRPKIVKEGFAILCDNNFNPDLVDAYGMDCYAAGFNRGFGIAIALSASFAIGGLIGHIVNKIKEKKEKP